MFERLCANGARGIAITNDAESPLAGDGRRGDRARRRRGEGGARDEDLLRPAGGVRAARRGARAGALVAGRPGRGARRWSSPCWRIRGRRDGRGRGRRRRPDRGRPRVPAVGRAGGGAEAEGDGAAAGRGDLLGRLPPRPDRGDGARLPRARAERRGGVGGRHGRARGRAAPARRAGAAARRPTRGPSCRSRRGPEALTPLVSVVRAQQFAREVALARGHDPDAPPGSRRSRRRDDAAPSRRSTSAGRR